MIRKDLNRLVPGALCAGMVAALAAAACDSPSDPTEGPRTHLPTFSTAPVLTRIEGAGRLGDGSPAGDGIWLQEFQLDVALTDGIIDGFLDYTDYSVIKPDGNPARLRVAPDEPGTRIATYSQVSPTCIEFAGMGKVVNTGELLAFVVEVCDNADPGFNYDRFHISVPQRPYARGDLLSGGELVAWPRPANVVLTAMAGSGEIGTGEPSAEGVDLRAFDLDVGVTNGVVGGSLDYTDYSVIKPDGNPAHLRAAPDQPGTAITEFLQISNTCVEFSGVGRLMNTGELLHFEGRACDNADPGVSYDLFGIAVPDRSYSRRDVLSGGELTRALLQ